MEYSSLSSWQELFSCLFCNEPSYRIVNPTLVEGCRERTRSQNEAGIAYLRGCSQDSHLVDEVWWFANALKKFKAEACAASPVQALHELVKRDDAITEVLPWWIEGRVRELLARALPEVPYDAVDGCFGPGAISEGLNSFARWNIASEPEFREPEKELLFSGFDEERPDLTSRARAQVVPKDLFSWRTITIEPGKKSFWQQWLRELIRLSINTGCLRGTIMDSFGCNDQCAYLQGRRAINASRGGLATIDLKDGSDRIGWVQVFRVFPSWLGTLMQATRSRYVDFDLTLPGEKSKKIVTKELRMYAGMGNASTYVVETLYFWAVFTAIAERLRDYTPVTAVGDDIICGQAASHPLFGDYVRETGLMLNAAKSFCSRGAGFREACGVAAYGGRQVATLIRIPGFKFDLTEYQQNIPARKTSKGTAEFVSPDRIRFAELVTRLSRSEMNLHNVLGESLECDAVDGALGRTGPMQGGPLTRINQPLQENTDCVVIHDLPPSRAVQEKSIHSIQHVGVKALVIRPEPPPRVELWTLRPTEALGFLNGQLRSDDSCVTGKATKHGRKTLSQTVIAVPKRHPDLTVKRVWVCRN